MGETIKLHLMANGFDDVEVDHAEYEAAKAAGDLDQFLDVYTSDIDTDVIVEEPDGTMVTLPEGNVWAPTLATAGLDVTEAMIDAAERAMARHIAADQEEIPREDVTDEQIDRELALLDEANPDGRDRAEMRQVLRDILQAGLNAAGAS